MKNRTVNEYFKASLGFAILSLVGSTLSIINIIPIFISFQLLHKAYLEDIDHHKYKLVFFLLLLSIIITIGFTVFYLSAL